MPLQRDRHPQQDSTMVVVVTISGGSDPVEPRFGKWTLALTVRFQSCRLPETPHPSFGAHGVIDESHGVDGRTNRRWIFGSAAGRAGVPWPQRWRLAGLGSDVSLDR